MCILSSRERACIHPEASRADNKNEACEELLKAEGGPACKYYRNAKFVTHNRPSSLSTAFDLEDFVSICKKQKCCPYYSSRELISASDIVFCPYNYLVDPLIRSAVSISLKGSIIIMDEAHNIEDNARSAASSSFDVVNLEESGVNLEKVGRYSKSDGQSYLYFSDIFKSMANWLKNHSSNLTDYQTFESSAKVYEGDDMLAVLSHVRIGPETFKEFDQKFESVLFLEKDKEAAEIIDLDQPKLSSAALAVMKKLREILNFLYKANMVYVPDYRLVVLKTRRVGQRLRGNRHLVVPANDLELTLNFWCLNPGVAFSDIKDCIHSLIVASGTLSPMASFESELGTTFHTTLEANHVVKKSQLWIGTIGKGPNNVSLNATFQNTGTFTFQDDVGSLILQICSIIPHGVLCFLPSYNLMDKLIDRWEQTGLLEKLSGKKEVLCEPRKIQYFQTVMDEFYGAISSSKNGTGNGALFFAVCRGKVSEGFDFADENARAVITVGIPFPSFKDSQVDLKKKYNDKYSSQRNILSGQEWYEIQAFRAINQALGRRIRHRDDFGALILIDERFQKCIRYQNSLSKWIRKDLLHFTYKDALESLNMFAIDTGLKALE
nr:Fanconi anemia group J protein homolog [Parasteatoda tepidariorum]